MTVVAEARVGGDVLLGPTLRAVPDATVETQYQATAETYTFAVEGCDYGDLEAALAADPTVANPRTIVDGGDRRVYRVDREVERPILSEVASDLNVQILAATGRAGEWTMRLRAPDRDALAALKRFCDDHDVGFRITRVYAEPGGAAAATLTPAQRELLVAAYRRGYFDQPRGVTLEELGESIGISSSAASGRLRRALRALVGDTVVDDPGMDASPGDRPGDDPTGDRPGDDPDG